MNEPGIDRRTWIRTTAGSIAALSAASCVRAAGANERRLRAAVIGRTGHGDYGHSLDTVWLEVPGAELVAVADDSPDGLQQAAARLKLDKTYADYRAMLDKEKPDVVSIAPRWIDKHHEIGMACAERGIHMYMEKPFVRTPAEADDIAAACQKTGAKLAIAFQSHYSPRAAAVKRLIQDGKLGTVLEYRARGKEDARGGAEDLCVLGPHMFDLIRFIGGDPAWCFALITEQGEPVTKQHVYDGKEGLGPLAGDAIQASYGMPDGSTAYFASRRGTGKGDARFGLQIFGSEGIVELMSGYMGGAKYLADPMWSPGRSKAKWQNVSSAGIDQPETVKVGGNIEGNRVAVVDLVAAIRESREPLCGLKEAIGTTEMTHAVFESHRAKARVALPLANREHALTQL